MKFKIAESKTITLAMIKKIQNDYKFTREMENLVDKYYPNQKSGDCIPINTSIWLALQELGVKDAKLINGNCLLDGDAFDPDDEDEGNDLEQDELWHFWISLGNTKNTDNIMDYAATVFHTKDGEQVYIEQYYYGDWNLTGVHESNDALKNDVKALILKYAK